MVDRNPIDLSKELRPLDFKDFLYSSVHTENQLFPEIASAFSFTFGRRDPNSFLGPTFEIKDGDEGALEATSFAEAAKRAWERYRDSEEYCVFVRGKLLKKWKELKGRKQTGIKLEFK